jgi:hypothetical protein
MRGHIFPPFRSSVAAARGADAGHEAASCLADEVVVDFPSIAPAVERMRRAFLGEERSTPLSAALRLSIRDAIGGITVPLDVPVRCTCRGCGGRGEIWTEGCARCAGTGTEVLRHQVQVSVPPGVEDGTRVHFTDTPPHQTPTRIELRIADG